MGTCRASASAVSRRCSASACSSVFSPSVSRSALYPLPVRCKIRFATFPSTFSLTAGAASSHSSAVTFSEKRRFGDTRGSFPLPVLRRRNTSGGRTAFPAAVPLTA